MSCILIITPLQNLSYKVLHGIGWSYGGDIAKFCRTVDGDTITTGRFDVPVGLLVGDVGTVFRCGCIGGNNDDDDDDFCCCCWSSFSFGTKKDEKDAFNVKTL